MSSSLCPEYNAPETEYNRYRIGQTVLQYNPAEENYRHMLRLVAYDITDSKRLRQVAKTCEDYGIRVEYSVFECDLSEELFRMMWNRLTDIIDEDEDRILAYRICGACVSGIHSIGTVTRPGKPLLYFI